MLMSVFVSNKDSKINSFKVTVRACYRDSLLQDNLWQELEHLCS